MAPSLEVLAIQAQQVQRQIDALRKAASEHELTFGSKRYNETEAMCLAAEHLMGQAWAGFQAAAKEAEQRRARGPACGHSACRQNWIETGSTECVDGQVELTAADRNQAQEAANRG